MLVSEDCEEDENPRMELTFSVALLKLLVYTVGLFSVKIFF